MLKFHIAISIWIESHFWKNMVKEKEKAFFFLQTGNITKYKTLKIF